MLMHKPPALKLFADLEVNVSKAEDKLCHKTSSDFCFSNQELRSAASPQSGGMLNRSQKRGKCASMTSVQQRKCEVTS